MAFYDIAGEFIVEELIEIEERAEFRLQQRLLRDMSNPFHLPEKTFKQIFRFKKDVANIIINLIAPHLVQGQRITAVPPELKILASLHFYATGGYQLTTGHGYNFAISQPTMSRCLDEVTNAIYNNLLAEWISFPETQNAKNKVVDGFVAKFNIPRCLGVIDCTHIAIISPPENYPAFPYFCRKGYYSINCQIIVDSDYNILNINARFPGSTHDAAIWQASNIKNLMENQYIRGSNLFIIGDSGYPLQPFLLTQFENPQEHTPEANYNDHFIRARNIIEKLNGVLKSRFRCLLKHRVLNYDPIKAAKIIYSCGVLHNISRFYNDDFPEEEIIEDIVDHRDENDDNLGVAHDQLWHLQGEAVRNEIVQQYFNN